MVFATASIVHDLTNKTFRGFVEENDMVLVAFVLPFLPNFQRFAREYEETGLSLAYIPVETVEERARLSKTVEPLGKKYKDKMLIFKVDAKNFESVAESLHLELDDLPASAIKEPVRGHRLLLKPRQQLSEEILNTFVKDFVEGKLKPTIKSDPVPEIQGSVTIVVGSTYDDLVINNDKDVLLGYYTQWCGPCKATAPTYEKLATLYALDSVAHDRVTIAKIDAEANDVLPEIRSFPIFKLFPAGSNESPVLCEGPWTIKDFANFVRDNGKHKVDLLLKSDTDESTKFCAEQPVA